MSTTSPEKLTKDTARRLLEQDREACHAAIHNASEQLAVNSLMWRGLLGEEPPESRYASRRTEAMAS